MTHVETGAQGAKRRRDNVELCATSNELVDESSEQSSIRAIPLRSLK
jgi:hypothetical protein